MLRHVCKYDKLDPDWIRGEILVAIHVGDGKTSRSRFNGAVSSLKLFETFQKLPTRELTYPTWGKGKSSTLDRGYVSLQDGIFI